MSPSLEDILIVREPITIAALEPVAALWYGTMIKGVVDIEKAIIALGGEYHIDANNRLIEEGSEQPDIWGFNIQFEKIGDEWLEYRSLINVRPAADNRSMVVKDKELQRRMREIIEKLILRS